MICWNVFIFFPQLRLLFHYYNDGEFVDTPTRTKSACKRSDVLENRRTRVSQPAFELICKLIARRPLLSRY